jgi:uridine kinase
VRAADELERLIRERNASVVGIGGAPGSGKSTLARDVATRFEHPLSFSLDDFCYSKAERSARGMPWRAAVGTHDLDALIDVLQRVRSPERIEVPRYSAEIDDAMEPRLVSATREIVLIDGWLLGHAADGYEAILEHLDLLVFLDVPDEVAKERRFAREDALRAADGGFSTDEMQRFWGEVLEPGIAGIIPGAKARADVVIDSH